MFKRETFRLIRKTFRRFMSLTLIVLIGSGFMMGLMSAPKTMRESVDIYYEETDLQDLQLYSPYGFCEEDVQAIRGIEYMDTVFPSRTIDVHATNTKGTVSTVRVTELVRPVNRYELVNGRLPENNNECLMLYSGPFPRFKVGDTVVLDYGSDDIFDYLKTAEFTVVGECLTPEYMAQIHGSSNFNNETLEGVLFVPNNVFISEYYTTIYLTLQGAERFMSFSRGYEKFVAEKKEDFRSFAEGQQEYFKSRIIAQAREELAKNEALLNVMASSGREELDSARAQLDEASAALSYYEAQLAQLGSLLGSLDSAISGNSAFLRELYNNAVAIEGGLVIFLDGMGVSVEPGALEELTQYALVTYDNVMDQYQNLTVQLANGRMAFEAGLAQYNDAVEMYNERIAEAEHDLALARQKLEELPEAKWMILDRDMQYSAYMYKNTCKQMASIARYLPVMFFLVAALVCLTTMKRLVDEQRGQIGIYAALGFSERQITGKYVTYAVMASAAGGAVGILFGQAVFPTVIYLTWRMMYQLPPMQIYFPAGNALVSVLSFGLLMGALTAGVVKDSLRDMPAALMRPKAPKTAKAIFLEKIPFIWSNLSFTSKITARNILRYKSRFFMTVFGIAGCTALLVLGFGLKDSVSDVMELQYGRIFNYDYQIYLEKDASARDAVDILLKDPENVLVCSYASYTTRLYFENDRDAAANAIILDPADAAKIFDLRATDKKTPLFLGDDGIIVSERFAENNGIRAGDTVTLESSDGLKAEAVVKDICEMYFQHYIFMSDDIYRDLFGISADASVVAVKSDNKQALMEDCAKITGFASLVSFSGMMDTFNKMVQALNMIILVIILVAGSLAFVVLMNLTQVNISERIREIATLKVLGFNDHEINMYLFKEILMLSLIGALLGLPLGIAEHHMVMRALAMEMVMFGMNIKPISFILSLLMTMVFTVIVLSFMRKPLRAVDMVESLKSVE